MSLRSNEQDDLVKLLQKLEPGFLPYEIFLEVARLVALPILELVPLRQNNGTVEVLLLQRDEDDVLWPGMVHTPGTVIRATDNEKNIYLAFERILKDELMGTKVSGPHFVGTVLHKSRRGTEHAQIYWVEVLGEPRTGEFYPVDSLPANIVESQPRFIKEAVKHYRREVVGSSSHGIVQA